MNAWAELNHSFANISTHAPRLATPTRGEKAKPRPRLDHTRRKQRQNKVILLLQTKRDDEIHFGKSATMAPNLLGMIGQGERSFGFLTGDMSQGFEITLGLFNDKARYL